MSYLADPGPAAQRRFERGANSHEGATPAVREVLEVPHLWGAGSGNGLAARRKTGG
jgi:hypothetical protein